jgi:hypothetical protein
MNMSKMQGIETRSYRVRMGYIGESRDQPKRSSDREYLLIRWFPVGCRIWESHSERHDRRAVENRSGRLVRMSADHALHVLGGTGSVQDKADESMYLLIQRLNASVTESRESNGSK